MNRSRCNAACFQAVVLFCALPAAVSTRAQDTRNVIEPVIPPVCATISAHLDYRGDRLSASAASAPDTKAIQTAMDTCHAGHAVRLTRTGEHNALLTGPLTLRSGVFLFIDQGVHLVASNRPSDYDRNPGSCGLTESIPGGCRPLFTVDHVAHTGLVGPGIVEGRGDQKLTGSDLTWWQMHDAVKGDVHHNIPWLIGATSADDFTLYGVTLRNAPNFNVFLNGGNGITVWGVRIDSPGNSPNTDGIDPSGSTNVTITQSFIRNGDDNIAIKAPKGQPATHMTISHNHFYEGHGMSIGSGTEGGVNAIRVVDLSIEHQKAGIHIKSNPGRGGLVTDVVYDDVCIRDSVTPINLETTYIDANAPRSKWINGEAYPTYRGIILHNVRTSGGTRLLLRGIDAEHRISAQFDGVQIQGIAGMKQQVEHASVQLGPAPSNWSPKGDDVIVIGSAQEAAPPSCSDKYLPFPAHSEE